MAKAYAGLPAPLVPAECSMAGDDWFPLYFDRLRKSKWWRRASDLARARNIMLWGEAYKGQPAGSLLDDDDDLAEAAGFGMDVDSFLAAKVEIMAPWTLCSDGRWYHPTVCEQVLDSWERRGSRRKAESARKAQYRLKVRNNDPVPPENNAVPRDTPTSPTGQPGRSHGTTPSVPAGLGPQTVQTGQEETSSLVASAAPSATARGQSDPWKRDQNFADLWAAATELMRRRGKSRDKVWREWAVAVKRLEPRMIVAALRRYVREDADVQRSMGQPGLHLWLKDRVFEQWLDQQADTSAITDERWARFVQLWMAGSPWSAELGPAPDQPGCLVPSSVLRAGGCEVPTVVGLRVVQ
jgi:hypothetical protein